MVFLWFLTPISLTPSIPAWNRAPGQTPATTLPPMLWLPLRMILIRDRLRPLIAVANILPENLNAQRVE
jgi:hypothetical protein